ncbi:hypothetical protein MKZ38_001346 [Zalerion maritima]|uniref:Uncharacterized protein n=1 Tax=Zalerion maritima TaxID=339359 RepID=A0AAD5RQF2_9PEZI|nr:hypothetical protein MKZ38_001346 [Zalerion maritima]
MLTKAKEIYGKVKSKLIPNAKEAQQPQEPPRSPQQVTYNLGRGPLQTTPQDDSVQNTSAARRIRKEFDQDTSPEEPRQPSGTTFTASRPRISEGRHHHTTPFAQSDLKQTWSEEAARKTKSIEVDGTTSSTHANPNPEATAAEPPHLTPRRNDRTLVPTQPTDSFSKIDSQVDPSHNKGQKNPDVQDPVPGTTGLTETNSGTGSQSQIPRSQSQIPRSQSPIPRHQQTQDTPYIPNCVQTQDIVCSASPKKRDSTRGLVVADTDISSPSDQYRDAEHPGIFFETSDGQLSSQTNVPSDHHVQQRREGSPEGDNFGEMERGPHLERDFHDSRVSSLAAVQGAQVAMLVSGRHTPSQGGFSHAPRQVSYHDRSQSSPGRDNGTSKSSRTSFRDENTGYRGGKTTKPEKERSMIEYEAIKDFCSYFSRVVGNLPRRDSFEYLLREVPGLYEDLRKGHAALNEAENSNVRAEMKDLRNDFSRELIKERNMLAEKFDANSSITQSLADEIAKTQQDLSESLGNKMAKTQRDLSESLGNKMAKTQQDLSESLGNKMAKTQRDLSESLGNKMAKSHQDLSESLENKMAKTQRDLSESLGNKMAKTQQDLSGSLGNKMAKTQQDLSAIMNSLRQSQETYHRDNIELRSALESANNRAALLTKEAQDKAAHIGTLKGENDQLRQSKESCMKTQRHKHEELVKWLGIESERKIREKESELETLRESTESKVKTTTKNLKANNQRLEERLARFHSDSYVARPDIELAMTFRQLSQKIVTLGSSVTGVQLVNINSSWDPTGYMTQNQSHINRAWVRFFNHVAWSRVYRGFFQYHHALGCFGPQGHGYEYLRQTHDLLAGSQHNNLDSDREVINFWAFLFSKIYKEVQANMATEPVQMFNQAVEKVAKELCEFMQSSSGRPVTGAQQTDAWDVASGCGRFALELASQRAHWQLVICVDGGVLSDSTSFREENNSTSRPCRADLITMPCLKRTGDGRLDTTSSRVVVPGKFVGYSG